MSTQLPIQELFIRKTLTFENKFINNEIIPVPMKDAKFGVLNLQAISTPVSVNDHDFVFMIDCSASMTDICSDNKTKMQHIIHTLKNMILYFKENPNIKNHITVNAFDDKIYNILERCTITNTNYNEVIMKIEEITPRGSTNIEMALQNVNEVVSKIKETCPDSIISNIFMTDGNATTGNSNYNTLAQLVDTSISNAFIGFGIHHDSTMLNSISNRENSAYYFIDQLENAGYVYGEILHGIMYKLLKNVSIRVENGLVYDYKNNIWGSSLVIGEIVSEANKIFHICSNDSDECLVTVNAHMANNIHPDDNSTYMEFIINHHNNVDDSITFHKYIYRQRTLQYLYMVKDYLKRKSDANIAKDSIFMNVNKSDVTEFEKEEIKIRESLRTFIVELKNSMLENNLYEDNFMKNLCDDIYICYRTFGTIYGDMYVSSRQRSQGVQRCYTVSHTPEDIDTHLDDDDDDDECSGGVLKPRLLTRRHTRSSIHGLKLSPPNRLSPPPLKHTMSKIRDAPYLTPTSTKIMREISGKNDIDSDNDSMSVEL